MFLYVCVLCVGLNNVGLGPMCVFSFLLRNGSLLSDSNKDDANDDDEIVHVEWTPQILQSGCAPGLSTDQSVAWDLFEQPVIHVCCVKGDHDKRPAHKTAHFVCL